MKYKSIKEEAVACRKRFKNIKVGAPVWFCHHGEAIEMLNEPPQNRINYILTEKPMQERAIRLHWFRPVDIKKMPKWLQKTYAEWQKADAEWQKAYAELQKADAEGQKADAELQKAGAEWQKADAEGQKADAELQKAGAEWQKAYAEWQKALNIHKKEINTLIKKLFPSCPWDGKTLFPPRDKK